MCSVSQLMHPSTVPVAAVYRQSEHRACAEQQAEQWEDRHTARLVQRQRADKKSRQKSETESNGRTLLQENATNPRLPPSKREEVDA
mmetsp:Transcript_24133/g.59661  ORF Transcript_24133/g.59661 Transcript_24133/m.59661 type:complete len:87 (-) Transcript_24133:4510-4770(-)